MPNPNFSRLLTYSASEPIPWQPPTLAVDIQKNRLAVIQMFEQLKLKRMEELRQQQQDEELVRQHNIENAARDAQLELANKREDRTARASDESMDLRRIIASQNAEHQAAMEARRPKGGSGSPKAPNDIDPVSVLKEMVKDDPSLKDKPKEELAQLVQEEVQFRRGLRGGAVQRKAGGPPKPMPRTGSWTPMASGSEATSQPQSSFLGRAQADGLVKVLPNGNRRIKNPKTGEVVEFDPSGSPVQDKQAGPPLPSGVVVSSGDPAAPQAPRTDTRMIQDPKSGEWGEFAGGRLIRKIPAGSAPGTTRMIRDPQTGDWGEFDKSGRLLRKISAGGASSSPIDFSKVDLSSAEARRTQALLGKLR